MSFVAAALLGASVTLLTLAVWPREEPRRELLIVEDSSVPRTIH